MAKRRTFTPKFKAQVVLEELTGVKDKAEICREYRLSRQLFSRWRAEFVERAPEIFATLVNLGSEAAWSASHPASPPPPGPSTIVTAPILGPRPIHSIWPRFALF